MNRETIIKMARESGLAEVTDTNQNLRQAEQALLKRYAELVNSGDAGNWYQEAELEVIAARQALALPTAEQVDDINVAESFTSVTKTAAPVGEREAFERTMMDKFGWQQEDFMLDNFGYFDGYTDTAWIRRKPEQPRAALSAGDAVLAEREACAKLCEEVADDLITAMREEGETDDDVMTSLVASARVCAKEIRGGYSKKFNPHNAAIDAAMRKDKT